MKKWREEGCPNIFKIEINKDTLEIKKENRSSIKNSAVKNG